MDPATRQPWCDCDVATDANCADYVAIYDGPNERSPLLARVTGEITDEINAHDTFTSSGRNSKPTATRFPGMRLRDCL